ncbi:hypothetical protein [Salinicoccus roseus]|uniref:hypothetical protein n=1 Tax=Salinicoccus roseus TaxID=45670 RepID=UPI001EF4D07F|nr:hypothetical protein [Salinicoccus roseus]MCG7332484.1 hypothetical protein [Salinicoccus roseus]
MKRQMMMAGLASALLLSACGNGDEASDAAENEDLAAAEETSDSRQAEITAEQQQSLDEKFNGIGESVRSGTAGILHDGADDKLPIVEFKNPDGDVIAHYDSHNRDANLIME